MTNNINTGNIGSLYPIKFAWWYHLEVGYNDCYLLSGPSFKTRCFVIKKELLTHFFVLQAIWSNRNEYLIKLWLYILDLVFLKIIHNILLMIKSLFTSFISDISLSSVRLLTIRIKTQIFFPYFICDFTAIHIMVAEMFLSSVLRYLKSLLKTTKPEVYL